MVTLSSEHFPLVVNFFIRFSVLCCYPISKSLEPGVIRSKRMKNNYERNNKLILVSRRCQRISHHNQFKSWNRHSIGQLIPSLNLSVGSRFAE